MSEEYPVHNHGPTEGPGLSCPERIVDGRLQGACLAPPAPEPGLSEEEVAAVQTDLRFLQQTHIDWAEWFEAYPDEEREKVATGEWDTAIGHRRVAACYDRVLALLDSQARVMLQLARERDEAREKVKLLETVNLIEVLEADESEAIAENLMLHDEIDALRARAEQAEREGAEMRAVIRGGTHIGDLRDYASNCVTMEIDIPAAMYETLFPPSAAASPTTTGDAK